MAKAKKKEWMCDNCGAEYPKWQGHCSSGCGEWNCIVEVNLGSAPQAIGKKRTMAGGAVDGQRRKATRMTEVKEVYTNGFSSGMAEADRVFGGNIPRGGVFAIAGQPGQGKSTILLQIAGNVAKNVGKVVYCVGEESENQVKNRAIRFGIDEEDLYFFNTENINDVIDAQDEIKPELMIVDSIQHIGNPEITSELGSVTQVKNCTSELITLAKTTGVSIIIVSHVTKDDKTIAGPKTFQHMVDGVFFLEGDIQTSLKLLTSRKNRYGKAAETGVFKLTETGMVEILNPSEHLLADRTSGISGSTIVCIPGTKPMLVEVQSLVADTGYENAIPRRTARGLERDRFSILVAVLEKRCGVRLSTKDIYLNVVGGLKLEETSSDLGVAIAIYSSQKDIVVDAETTFIGEVGLAGEIRPVPNIESLVLEAERNGFERFILPERNAEDARKIANKIKIVPTRTLKETLSLIE